MATTSSSSSAPSRVAVLRGQVQQAAHGVLGAPGDERLERAGGGEDDDQQRAVEDLPDRRRDERGHDHQQVDVQGPLAQRLQPGQGRLPAPGGVAGEVHVHHDHAGAPASCSAPPTRKSSGAAPAQRTSGRDAIRHRDDVAPARRGGRDLRPRAVVDGDRVDGTMLLLRT